MIRKGRAMPGTAQPPARHSRIAEQLRLVMPDLRERFGVASLAVFGSCARGDDTPASDVDLLVEFAGPTTFANYLMLRDYLSERLDRKVDLVMKRAVKPYALPGIERESIRVA
jgi:predicted nucleotidyltransferase